MIGVGGSGDADSRCPHLSIKFYGMPAFPSLSIHTIRIRFIDHISTINATPFTAEVPSPARLQRMQNHNQAGMTTEIVSPLIWTVPLLQKESSITADRNVLAPSFMGHNKVASPAAEIPIQILLGDSGLVGVAFIHSESPAVQVRVF